MPKMLYNEGRVVGASAYEIYVKQALSENPEDDPLSEREWLASSLNHGLSMILRVPEDDIDGVHYVDFALPEGSRLATASSIFGSLFLGECEYGDDGWATKVTSYGRAMSNDEESHPKSEADARLYPAGNMAELSETEKSQVLQYIKVQDGVVMQPGTWTENQSKPPFADLHADLHGRAVVRLVIENKVSDPFSVVLTGFSHKTVLASLSNVDTGSAQELHPENGDFLGPVMYPWASKILFSFPPIAQYYMRKGMRSTQDNLRIDASDEELDVLFTASYLRPELGISIDGPDSPGGDITLGSKVTSPNHLLNVSQTRFPDDSYKRVDIEYEVDDDGNVFERDKDYPDDPALNKVKGHVSPAGEISLDFDLDDKKAELVDTEDDPSKRIVSIYHYDAPDSTTEIEHADIVPGPGIQLNLPESEGDVIDVSAVISALNNYVKIEQVAGMPTRITPSNIVGGDGIQVQQPKSPGDDVKVSAPIKAGQDSWIQVKQEGGTTTISSPTISSNGPLTATYNKATNELVFQVNVAKLVEEITKHDNNLMKAIKYLYQLVPGLELNSDFSPNDTAAAFKQLPIARGNLNISTKAALDSDSYDCYIRTHSGNLAGDVRFS